MFTLRIDRGRARERREVYGCARYIVTYDGNGAARASLVGASDGKGGQLADPHVVTVGADDECYVMNDVGQTVDTIRARRPAARAAGGGR